MTSISLALTRVLLLLTATALQTLGVAPPNHAPDEAHQERFHRPSNAPTSSCSGASKTNKGSPPDEWTGPKVQRLWSRFGSFYFPYAFVFFFWTLVVFEVPRSLGHEDPLNIRFVSGTLVTALGSLRIRSAPLLRSLTADRFGMRFELHLRGNGTSRVDWGVEGG